MEHDSPAVKPLSKLLTLFRTSSSSDVSAAAGSNESQLAKRKKRRGSSDGMAPLSNESSIEDEFQASGVVVGSGPQQHTDDSSGEKSKVSQMLDAVLQRRDTGASVPHHVDLRSDPSATTTSTNDMERGMSMMENADHDDEAEVESEASTEGRMVDKLLRLLPAKHTDLVAPMDVYVRTVTGERLCLKLGALPFSEISATIRKLLVEQQNRKVVASQVTLDKLVQHVHIRPADAPLGKVTPRDGRKLVENESPDTPSTPTTPGSPETPTRSSRDGGVVQLEGVKLGHLGPLSHIPSHGRHPFSEDYISSSGGNNNSNNNDNNDNSNSGGSSKIRRSIDGGNNNKNEAVGGRSSANLHNVVLHDNAPWIIAHAGNKEPSSGIPNRSVSEPVHHHVPESALPLLPLMLEVAAPHLLNRLPVAIASCRRMTCLTIEKQQLLSIEEVLMADALEELRIISCDLREVPGAILQRLPRLRILDVRGNLLNSLPLVGTHDKLQVLDMSQNQITTFPHFISRLPALLELDLSYNKLSTLPVELRNLSQLTRLNLEGNTLLTPSVALIRGVFGSIDVVARFSQLITLNLSRNKITELPSSMDYLTSLTELNVSDNKLTRVSALLTAIPNLSVLDLSGNMLGPNGPPEISLIKSLRVLRLSRNNLKSLPERLHELNHLSELVLSHNKLRDIDRSSFSGMMALTSLDVSNNQLVAADFLLELHNLIELDLSYNNLTALPEEVDALESLKTARLARNKIVKLPESFMRLYNLEDVDLTQNAIEVMGSSWDSSSFPRLRVLKLEGNPGAAQSLQSSFATLQSLESISLLGIVVDKDNLYIQNRAKFDFSLVVQLASKVRHPLLLSAFFGLSSLPEYHERILVEGIGLMLSLCDVRNSTTELIVHAKWPPSDMYQPDTARYHSLRCLTALTSKMDANGPRWTIYLHGAPAVLMDVINRHPDVRYKLLCIRLLGNLALHNMVKSQIFHEKSEIVAYLEDLARTSHSDSIKRFCNRTFAIFGICQRFHRSHNLSLSAGPNMGGRQTGIRILSLDGGGTRCLITVEILRKLRDMTGKSIIDMFDLVVGTSAGGLVALSFLINKSLEEMADMYLNRGYQCFSPQDVAPEPTSTTAGDRNATTWNKTIRPMINLATKGAMYRSTSFERELRRYYGNSTMISTAENERNPKVAVVSTLTSLKPAVPYISRNYDYPHTRTSRYSGDLTWKLWEVGRSTSAAPSFFDPYEREGLQLMDGGIVANNPTAIAYHEARAIWGHDVPIALILSIGTGSINPASMSRDRGIMETLEQLVDAALSQERVHEIMMDMLPPDIPYFRLNPQGSAFGIRLDEIRKPELLKLQAETRAWIKENDHVFVKLADICARKDSAPVVWQDEGSTDDTQFAKDVTEEENVDEEVDDDDDYETMR